MPNTVQFRLKRGAFSIGYVWLNGVLVCGCAQVGGVAIRSKETPAKDVLQDLAELCTGVQNPMRGLFLRDYLSKMSRDKLPDIGNEYEG